MASENDDLAPLRQTLGDLLAIHRNTAGLTQKQLGQAIGYSRVTVGTAESGHRQPAAAFWTASDKILGAGGELIRAYRQLTDARDRRSRDLAERDQAERSRVARAAIVGKTCSDLSAQTLKSTVLDLHEPPFRGAGAGMHITARTDPSFSQLRMRALEAVHGESAFTGSGVSEWDRIVQQHGNATRYVGSNSLLPVLAQDFSYLQRDIERRPSLSTLRELTRASARLAGLISLTFLKAGEVYSSRLWSRTGWLISLEVGDTSTSSWIAAQDAYSLYYDRRIEEAIDVAQHAQSVAHNSPSVGFILAAALEARAHATLGRSRETHVAIGLAEEALGRLEGPSVANESAFYYDEAQLRFHQSSTLTKLGDFKGAVAAQQQALSLYQQHNYMDRSLVLLDRAEVLARQGDVHNATTEVVLVLEGLTLAQRDRLIIERALDVCRAFRDHHARKELAAAIVAVAGSPDE